MKEQFPDADVTGIDVAGPMLRYAHKRAVDLKSDVHFVQRLAEETGIDSGSVDLVTAYILFHEVPVAIAQKICAEAFRILRPGGVFDVTDFATGPQRTAEPPFATYRSWADHQFNGERWREEFVNCDFLAILRDAGFTAELHPSKLSWMSPNYVGTKARLSMKRTQVIIVGAGPVGCVAAYRLALRGIDVLLLESQPRCPEDMRASTFHAPTLGMMDELGLLDTLEAQGLRAPVYQYRNRETGEVLSFDLGEIADAVDHPYRLQCEQYKLSRLVTGLLAEHPHAEVKFERRLLGFEQDEHGVTAYVESPLAIETCRGDYLIGVDGANSIVRKWLGVEFEGFTYGEKFLTLTTDWPMESRFEDLAYVSYMADATEWCVLLRVPSLWRVLVPAIESDSDAWLVSDEKKNTVFSGLMGDGASVTTHHRTLYKVHQRVAKRYHGTGVCCWPATRRISTIRWANSA